MGHADWVDPHAHFVDHTGEVNTTRSVMAIEAKQGDR